MESKELVISRLVGNRNPYKARNHFSFIAATAYSKVADKEKTEIDAFIARTHIDKVVGYEQPTTICSGKSQIDEYGCAAKCADVTLCTVPVKFTPRAMFVPLDLDAATSRAMLSQQHHLWMFRTN